MSESAATQLLEAVQQGDERTVRRLVEEQPDLSRARDAQGVSAISLALYRGYGSIARTLADAAHELDLFEACSLGWTEQARQLLDRKPSLAQTYSPDGFPCLALAAYFGHAEIVDLLLDHGADPNAQARNDTRVTSLHAAAARGHSGIIDRLLKAGADAHVRQQGSFTALHGAAATGDAAAVEMLLSAGADPDAKNESGQTARDIALERGHEALAARLGG